MFEICVKERLVDNTYQLHVLDIFTWLADILHSHPSVEISSRNTLITLNCAVISDIMMERFRVKEHII